MSDLENESAAFAGLILRAVHSEIPEEMWGHIINETCKKVLKKAETRGIRKCIEKLRSESLRCNEPDPVRTGLEWADWLERELLPKEDREK